MSGGELIDFSSNSKQLAELLDVLASLQQKTLRDSIESNFISNFAPDPWLWKGKLGHLQSFVIHVKPAGSDSDPTGYKNWAGAWTVEPRGIWKEGIDKIWWNDSHDKPQCRRENAVSCKILVETQFSRTLYVVHDPRCAIPRSTILGGRPGFEPQHSRTWAQNATTEPLGIFELRRAFIYKY